MANGKAHIIVFANEKGGSGKSTTAVHTAVALAAAGARVAAIDLDTRQKTLTRYLENREATARRLGVSLTTPRYGTLGLLTDAGLDHDIARLGMIEIAKGSRQKTDAYAKKETLCRQLASRKSVTMLRQT